MIVICNEIRSVTLSNFVIHVHVPASSWNLLALLSNYVLVPLSFTERLVLAWDGIFYGSLTKHNYDTVVSLLDSHIIITHVHVASPLTHAQTSLISSFDSLFLMDGYWDVGN